VLHSLFIEASLLTIISLLNEGSARGALLLTVIMRLSLKSGLIATHAMK